MKGREMNDGGPAMPTSTSEPCERCGALGTIDGLTGEPFECPYCFGAGELVTYGYGLTKREFFAAAAMQGLLAADRYPEREVAEVSYRVADSMLAAGEVQGDG